MGLFDTLHNKTLPGKKNTYGMATEYEFCPKCEANLTLQKGYSNELSFWKCRGCGEMLLNPNVDAEDDVAWICDECGALLNCQTGFSQNTGIWKCTECGFDQRIDKSELYFSEDEYQISLQDPYKGLKEKEVLELSCFEEVECLADRTDIVLVRNMDDGSLWVRKMLKNYEYSVYQYIQRHPVEGLPRFLRLYEGSNNLIVLEEYIEGRTLSDLLKETEGKSPNAIEIAKSICKILIRLHGIQPPLIHRDIKPSNIMIGRNGKVYLLDLNVAKWFHPEEAEDTRLFGTLYYAAPEQMGYGFASSSAKVDIYAMGILLNVLWTGKFPKEEKAIGEVWNIIEKCIHLDAAQRYTAEELLTALERIQE